MIKKYLGYILIFMFIVGCKNESETIHGLVLQDSFCDNYTEKHFPEKQTFSDNKHEFSIDFPISWYPEDGLIDSTYGVTATDTTYDFTDVILVTVTEHNTKYTNLKEYFSDEILSIQFEPDYKAYEIGQTKINNKDSYWVLYEMTADNLGEHRGLIYYMKGNRPNQFYLIESTVYGTEKMRGKICKSMEIIETFKLKKNGAQQKI